MEPTHPAAFRPERKLITILFADIQGSLALIAGLDPERADEILTAAVTRMSDAVRRFGGTVNRVTGDGIMALFGAPLAQERHALQACLAAIAIRDEAQQKLPGAEDVPIVVRVGLHTGEVVVRNLTTDTSTNYEAMGDVVSIAARMEQNAEPGHILITADTRQQAGKDVAALALGLRPIKGWPEPVEVFDLLKPTPDDDLLHRGRQTPLTGYVGRTAELLLLDQAARDARSAGLVVGVSGEAGTGKSRLVREFLERSASESRLVLRGHAQSFGGSSYRVVLEMVHACFRIAPGDPAGAVRDKIARGVERLGSGEAGELSQALIALCDAGDDDPAWKALDPVERRNRIAAALCDLFLLLAHQRQLVLVAEDLHWIDADSLYVLDRLAARVPAAPVLLLITFRPEFIRRWDGLPHYRACPVPPLNDAESVDLLRSLVLPGEHAADLQHRLSEHARGNPLFIEECLSALADTGELQRQGPYFQVVRPVASITLPPSLRALVTARVDRLPQGDKDALQAASVIGPVVAPEILERMLGWPHGDLLGTLQRLAASQFLLTGDAAGDQDVYRFRHALTRDAVYRSMLLRSRSAWHGRVITAIEQLRADRIGEYLETLAAHASLAEDWRRAVDYSRRSARKLIARSSNQDGVRFLEQAAAALEHWPDDEEKRRAQVAVLMEQRFPLFKLGRLADVATRLNAALPLAMALGDARQLALLNTYKSHIRWVTGDSTGALDAARRALAAADVIGDDALRVRARFQEGMVLTSRGDYARGIEAISSVLRHISPERNNGSYPDVSIAVTAQSYLSRAHAEIGSFDEAAQACEGAIGLAESIEDPFSIVMACIACGFLRLAQGDFTAARQWMERACDGVVTADAAFLLPIPTGFLGMALLLAGDPEAARRTLVTAVQDAAAIGFSAGQPYRLAALARASLGVGAVAEARDYAEQARRLATTQVEPFGEATALFALGEIALACGSGNEAQAFFADALAVATRHMLRPMENECRARLAGLGGG